MCGRKHYRNVDLAFKKLKLRTTTKSATNMRRIAANVNGAVDGMAMKPKEWSCKSRRDKSYKTIDKTSSKVRWTGETSSKITTKAVKKRKGKKRGEHGRDVVIPSSLIHAAETKRKKSRRERLGLSVKEREQRILRETWCSSTWPGC
jgi:hypothetical protein